MNAWCTAYYALYFFGFTSASQMRDVQLQRMLIAFGYAGAGIEAVSFCLANTDAARQVLLYCICGAAGQARSALMHVSALRKALTTAASPLELHFFRNLKLRVACKHHHHDDAQGACPGLRSRWPPLTASLCCRAVFQCALLSLLQQVVPALWAMEWCCPRVRGPG